MLPRERVLAALQRQPVDRAPYIEHLTPTAISIPFWTTMLSLGMDALHPFEPGAMDPVLVKQRYGDRIALVGNISVDLLSRGTPDQVRAETRQRIDQLASGYGYCSAQPTAWPTIASRRTWSR